jgi:hypothetical protein
MNNKGGRVFGAILVIVGALFLLKNLNIMSPFFEIFDLGYLIGTFWPSLFLLIPAFFFHYGFFAGRKRDPGLLVPGGILLVLGVVFQINMLFGGWDVTWPLNIFAVAFGLFELYYFGNREKGLLIPIFILSGVSLIFFTTFSLNELFGYNTRKVAIPFVLIAIGLLVIFGGRKKKEF